MKYEIVDNFLEIKEFKKIQDVFLSKTLPWFLEPYINSNSENHKLENKYDYYFSHIFFLNHNEQGILKSPFLGLMQPLLDKLSIKYLKRIKANLYPSSEKILEHAKHIDYNFKHTTALFYINTNNGYTNLQNTNKIMSKENRYLKFDGDLEHNSSTCTNQKYRITVVLNYIEK
jgi:hypothetical protein